LWAVARADLGMSREEFLACSPLELEAMIARLEKRRDHARFLAAMVCASIFNVNCDFDKRPEGFSPADFMPGKRSPADDLTEFALECQRNDFEHIPTEEDKRMAEIFRAQMSGTFKLKDN
jgi:hypothetical protein